MKDLFFLGPRDPVPNSLSLGRFQLVNDSKIDIFFTWIYLVVMKSLKFRSLLEKYTLGSLEDRSLEGPIFFGGGGEEIPNQIH